MINIKAEVANIRKSLNIIEASIKAAEPVPVPTIPPLPAFKFDLENINPATWQLGKSVDLPLIVHGYPEFQYTYVKGDDKNTWIGSILTVKAGDRNSVPFVPAAPGDFIKAWPLNALEKAVDGPRMPTGAVEAPSPSVPATPSPVGIGGAAFVNPLRLGVNIERMRPTYMTYKGIKLNQPDYYWYLKNLGVNFSRFFVPMNFAADRGCGIGVPGDGAINSLLDCAAAALAAGQSVVFGGVDVVDIGDAKSNWGDYTRHVDNVAKLVAARAFDPAKFSMECANELAEGDNEFWNQKRLDLHDIIRKRLPQPYVISHGACGWNGWRGFDDTWAMPSDNCIAAQFHHYENRADWSQVANSLGEFASKRGIPIYNGELGDDFLHMDQSADGARWAANFAAFASTAPQLRPCLWAVTDGHDFRLNASASDAAFAGSLEGGVRDAAATLKAKLG